MDIYDYLKMDHKKVAHLFKMFEDSKLEKRQKEIVALIAQELLVHAHSEQETFYRALSEHSKEKEMVTHAESEHRDIEDQINVVMNTKTVGKKWNNAVLKLKDIVDHHVNEEEGKVFRKAKKVISSKEAMIIKEKMHYLKGKLLLAVVRKNQKEAPVKKKQAMSAKK